VTVVSYPLGTPLDAEDRGGDCSARDLTQGRNVYGPHVFAASVDCRISNGLLRLTVGIVGSAPAITVEAYTGGQVVSDTYSDTYSDDYGGSISSAGWAAMGVVTIDSSSLSALLTGVRLVRRTPEAVTVRLIASVMGDAFVTLRRGERKFRIQHGSSRAPKVTTDRRVRWTHSPSPVGVAFTNRVEETAAAIPGLLRFLACLNPSLPDAGQFSLVASGHTARFAAGAASYVAKDSADDMHRQLADESPSNLVLELT
jgi:hypothetical protein